MNYTVNVNIPNLHLVDTLFEMSHWMHFNVGKMGVDWHWHWADEGCINLETMTYNMIVDFVDSEPAAIFALKFQ